MSRKPEGVEARLSEAEIAAIRVWVNGGGIPPDEYMVLCRLVSPPHLSDSSLLRLVLAHIDAQAQALAAAEAENRVLRDAAEENRFAIHNRDVDIEGLQEQLAAVERARLCDDCRINVRAALAPPRAEEGGR